MVPTTEALISAAAGDIETVLSIAPVALDRPVPSCPGWLGADVLAHLGRVFTSVSQTIDRRAQEMIPRAEMPEAPPVTRIVEWVDESSAALLRSLRSIEPDEPVWSWSTDRRGRFYHRRMAHEIAVHRYDLESAIGSPDDGGAKRPGADVAADGVSGSAVAADGVSGSAVAADGVSGSAVAADGVDEYLDLVLPFSVARWPRPIPAVRLNVVALDRVEVSSGVGQWSVRRNGDGIALDRSPIDPSRDEPTVTVSGPAGALRLWVWNRPSAVTVAGDLATASAWAALAP